MDYERRITFGATTSVAGLATTVIGIAPIAEAFGQGEYGRGIALSAAVLTAGIGTVLALYDIRISSIATIEDDQNFAELVSKTN